MVIRWTIVSVPFFLAACSPQIENGPLTHDLPDNFEEASVAFNSRLAARFEGITDARDLRLGLEAEGFSWVVLQDDPVDVIAYRDVSITLVCNVGASVRVDLEGGAVVSLDGRVDASCV